MGQQKLNASFRVMYLSDYLIAAAANYIKCFKLPLVELLKKCIDR